MSGDVVQVQLTGTPKHVFCRTSYSHSTQGAPLAIQTQAKRTPRHLELMAPLPVESRKAILIQGPGL